ncbi:MAG: hypothetical protein R2747_17740 [Pyrinomonadaceae bacterium]
MFGKIALILGILGVLLGGLALIISVALPILTDGRTSWEEALLGIIPSAVFLFFAFILAVIGLILVIKGRKKKA